MGQVMMITRGGQAPGNWLPTFTYTGLSQLFDEGNGNWNIRFLTSGTFTSNLATAIQVFLTGGGGAGSKQGGAGGGGYSTTTSGIAMLSGTPYPIVIGNGGATTGASGGSSTAFNCTGNGGQGGISGTITGQTCVVKGTTDGNIYSYASLSATAVSIGGGQQTVNLAYPITSATHNNGTYLYKGVSGYYRCNIVSYGAYIGTGGSNGAGGSAVYAFGGSSGTLYGGAGSAPSTVSGSANMGKGGGGSSNYNGSAFGSGGSGIAIIRNVR